MANRKKSEVLPIRRGPADGEEEDPMQESGKTSSSAQLRDLEEGVRLLGEQNFAEAKEWFDRAAEGPDAAIAHIARTRSEICSRRLGAPPLDLQSPEEHYHYGVER